MRFPPLPTLDLRHESRDRWSLEWLLEHGVPQGLVVGGVGFIWFGPLGFVVMFVIGAIVSIVAGRIAAKVAAGVYAPRGDSTAYTPTYSQIDALIIRGDLDAAGEAFEQEIARAPNHVGLLVKAADFHLRERRDAARALALYQAARTAGTGSAEMRRYIQQKLVDVYLGPLQDEGRAMVELRRLIDAFPGTREADAAKASLADLKARRAE